MLAVEEDLDSRQHVSEPRALALIDFPPLHYTLQPKVASLANEHLTKRQAETVARACQALVSGPRGFFLGDGPGTGKTRILAAIALEFSLCQPTVPCLWLVPNAMLKAQAATEMKPFANSASSLYSYAQLRNLGSLRHFKGCLLLLDEAHLARNDSSLAQVVNTLQEMASAVLYATATPASNIARIGYMKRLGIWGRNTAFKDHADFTVALRKWGLGAAELLALDLKQRGLYSCNRLPELRLVHLELSPGPLETECFNRCVQLWNEAQPALALRFAFFQRLVPSLKARLLKERWLGDLDAGFALVIVLQSTGASAVSSDTGDSMLRRYCSKAGLLFDDMDALLPHDALLEVKLLLTPEPVAEISGRSVALRNLHGTAQEQERSSARGSSVDLAAFRRGDRRVLIMSSAGSLGLNITSPLPIRMYLLEMPWTPETLAQQLGRCHRLNQRPPEYFSVSLRTFAERRVEAVLSSRGSTLGALSCADQSTTVLASLPWSRHLVRWVTLEMTVRLLCKRLRERGLQIRVMDWAEPLNEPREEGRPSETHRYFLNLLPRSELLCNPPYEMLSVLRTVARECAGSAAWLVESWSPEDHPKFSLGQRRAIFVAAAGLSLQGNLPAPLVETILSFAFGSSWDVEAAVQCLGETFLDLQSPQDFLEAAVASPLHIQQRLMLSCEENAAFCQPRVPRIQSVEMFCLRRAHPGIAISTRTRPEQARKGSFRLVDVEVTSTGAKEEQPLLYCTKHGRLAHAKRVPGSCQVALSFPGHSLSVQGQSFASLEQLGAASQTWVPIDANVQYISLEKAQLSRRAARASSLSKTLLLAVQNPLLHWETSRRVVLSFQDTSGRSVVGLLMDEKPLFSTGVVDPATS